MNPGIKISQKLASDISSLNILSGLKEKVEVEMPKDPKFGDYSTNIAMKLSKKGQSAMELAAEIKEELDKASLEYIERIEVVKPGFINFFISADLLISQLRELPKDVKKADRTGQTYLVEYTDPNPFKELHLGHLYSNIVGESIARSLEYKGIEVKRLCYQGDVGLHVAKAIYGMQKKMKNQKLNLKDIENENLETRMKFLGESYALGASDFEEREEAKSEIIELNKKIYAKDEEIKEFYDKGRAWSLQKFDEIYARLGTKFDKFYFESEVASEGVDMVKKYLKEGIFEESEGAIIFDGDKYGLHKRVFVNSLGLPTYEAKELALAEAKFKDFSFEKSIIVTAKEVSDYFKVVIKAFSLIHPDSWDKIRHIGHGFVKLPQGKMSSRFGSVITAEWLLNEVVGRIKSRFSDMDSETAEIVGVGAVKYALLKSGIGKDIVFNVEESISLEGNSGPYLQYTYVRCRSVLEKVGLKEKDLNNFKTGDLSTEEERLLKIIAKFRDIDFFTEDFSQHVLCSYLYELASDFNLFYQKCPILKSEKEEFRLALTKGTSLILEQGFYLLGIETPKRM